MPGAQPPLWVACILLLARPFLGLDLLRNWCHKGYLSGAVTDLAQTVSVFLDPAVHKAVPHRLSQLLPSFRAHELILAKCPESRGFPCL